MAEHDSYVDQGDFVSGMADTVQALNDLTNAMAQTPERHGMLPSAAARAMSDIAEEARFAKLFGDDWPKPVSDTHSFGGMTLVAAADYGHSYAALFSAGQERAPVFGHLPLARSALEASIVSSWLNDPRIDTIERVKRGMCEQLYSAWETKRLRIEGDEKSTALDASLRRAAAAYGWTVADSRGKPKVDGTVRPSNSARIAEILTGNSEQRLGRVQWSFLSAVSHVTWYGIVQGIVEPPDPAVGVGQSIAKVGTASLSVNAQSICLLRALRYAGHARFTLMGWQDDEAWADALRQAENHERALLAWMRSALEARETQVRDSQASAEAGA